MSYYEPPADAEWTLMRIADAIEEVAIVLAKLVKLSTPEPVTKLRAKMPPRLIPFEVGADAGFMDRSVGSTR